MKYYSSYRKFVVGVSGDGGGIGCDSTGGGNVGVFQETQKRADISIKDKKLSEISPSAFVWIVAAYVAQSEPGNQELMP